MRNVSFRLILISGILILSCKNESKSPTSNQITDLNLKRGALISCGPEDKQFGSVDFPVSCGEEVKSDFNLAIALLHSFEYDEAEKVFAKIIDKNPSCAMAYWGVAMCNYHPLWTPPTEPELKKGAAAAAIALSIPGKTKKEADYIDAISAFYSSWDSVDHHSRTMRFEKAMQKLYIDFPTDPETTIFYALALDAAADPSDKTYKNQKKADSLLKILYLKQPNHPGIAHYIIHTNDYPGLASSALDIARRYASIAPSSAHAQHMPSHIFTRLGLWDESIASNLASVASAQCYAQSAGIKGHWDEELHGMDYLVYAYLQKGQDSLAKAQWNYLNSIEAVSPVNFKVAYAFAAIPCRYVLENKTWSEAAVIPVRPSFIPWKKFPWQEAMFHFTRLLGAVHVNKMDQAHNELIILNTLRDTLVGQKDSYKANQVLIQIKAGQAWILFKEGKSKDALPVMQEAAEMEDKTEKHPVTPGELIPARELLGDLLLEMNKPDQALTAFESDLLIHPNRLNGLRGAAIASMKSNNRKKAEEYTTQLITLAVPIPVVQK